MRRHEALPLFKCSDGRFRAHFWRAAPASSRRPAPAPADGNGSGKGGNNGSGGRASRRRVAKRSTSAMPPTAAMACSIPGEKCDDGNKVGGDGCTPICQIENGWVCPTAGGPACAPQICGDGILHVARSNATTATRPRATVAHRPVRSRPVARVPFPGKPAFPSAATASSSAANSATTVTPTTATAARATCQVEPGATCPGTSSAPRPGVVHRLRSAATVSRRQAKPATAAPATREASRPAAPARTASSTVTAPAARRPAPRSRSAAGRPAPVRPTPATGSAATETSRRVRHATTATTPRATAAHRPARSKPDSPAPRRPSPTRSTARRWATPAIAWSCPVKYRDFKNESVSGGHPDFFFLGSTWASTDPRYQAITGVQGQTGATSFNKRYCVPNSSGPARPE